MSSDMPGKIVTFYSYKGGTGRSMAVANIAWILASNGKRVLAVDWDLEAPGLHRYFHPFLLDKELTSSEGVIDFVSDFAAEALTPVQKTEDIPKDWYVSHASILNYAVSINWTFPRGGTLDFVPAGRQEPSYAKRVNSFDWENFYDRLGGGIFLEAVKRQMRSEYNYILIDSRTGLSDTSGICTVQMPDVLVVCFTYNNQSIRGAAKVAQYVYEERRDSRPRILPVPMRVDFAEKERLDRAREAATKEFALFLKDLQEEDWTRYWGDVEVVYVPYYAYQEVLATFNDSPGLTNSVLACSERLTTRITEGEVRGFVPSMEPERRDIFAPSTPQRKVDIMLKNNPELQPLYAQVTEKQHQWITKRKDASLLLDSQLVSRLQNVPGLLNSLLETLDFRLFWKESLEHLKRKEQTAVVFPQYATLFGFLTMGLTGILVGVYVQTIIPNSTIGIARTFVDLLSTKWYAFLWILFLSTAGAAYRLLLEWYSNPREDKRQPYFVFLGRILPAGIVGSFPAWLFYDSSMLPKDQNLWAIVFSGFLLGFAIAELIPKFLLSIEKTMGSGSRF